MALFVFFLVVIDVVILGVYSLSEGLRGNLGVKLIVNRKFPRETVGVRSFFLLVWKLVLYNTLSLQQ